jgi:hypothetical protein
MSKFDEVIAKCAADLDKMGGYDAALLTKVAKGLGPSIYNRDASTVAASDPEELKRVKTNFLIKKLGLKDSPALDAAISEVVGMYDKRHKFRVVFYYLLAKKLKQESFYK